MKKRNIAASLTLFVLTLTSAERLFASTTTPALNNTSFTVGKGDLETDVSLVPQIFRGDIHRNNVSLKLGGNYFMTDILAPGVSVEYDHMAGADSFRLLPNLKAYWPLHKKILPYVQAGIGYAHVGGANLFDLAVGPGVNYLLSSSVAIGFQFRYDLGVGNKTIHEIQFPFQFAVYFKI